jgi:hypothetical protein
METWNEGSAKKWKGIGQERQNLILSSKGWPEALNSTVSRVQHPPKLTWTSVY